MKWEDLGALFTPSEKTKLNGIEDGADVTDATNVNSAGAVMADDASIVFDVVAEKTGGAGVTVDGVLLKDGAVKSAKLDDVSKLILDDPTELTISGGSITITKSYHTVDTESNDATDDLDTIFGGESGQILIIRPVAFGRAVVVKNGNGANQISCGSDFTMSHYRDNMILLFDSALSLWIQLSRADNS